VSDERELHRARDEKARTAIRTRHDATFFVEAGAGTGKTKALVDRVLALVLAGRQIERIVAITFTEKAAAELRDRVRGALEEALAEPEIDSALIRRALDGLERAQISTIHAFGLSLMRAFAAEAGTDPAFAVQDEMRAERRLEERWRLYLRDLHRDPVAVEAIERIMALGLGARELQTLARELTQLPGLAADLLARPLAPPAAAWPGIPDMLAELDALQLNLASAGDVLRQRVEELRALVQRLSRAGDDRELVLASGAAVLMLKWGVSNAVAWGGSGKITHVRDVAKDVQSQLAAVLPACRAAALADVLPLIVAFVRDDAAARRREGALIFDDLILGPRDLLLNHPDAARVLRGRFDTLLIDEFQDTDPLQVDIAAAFATDPATGAFEPGRLFLVGDQKQSIYRFRRADMAVYAKTREMVAGGGTEFATLALNRRSRPVIIDWVNHVFRTIIGDGGQPHIQPPYTPIGAERDTELKGPGMAIIGDVETETAGGVRQHEAAAVAAQCRIAVEDGWEVEEREGRIRPASFRDIAILIPARTILPALERALTRAGIPYRVEGGSLIYQTQEVRDLINCLAAIDDPADEVAVAGALRSTAFACSDVDLARHRAAGGRFNYLANNVNTREGTVAGGLRSLRIFHEARHARSLAALVERFVAERGQDESGVLAQGTRDSFRRMRFVVEQARAFESNGPESLRAFVAWMERRAGSAIFDHEGTGLDDDEDAVRILTVHGAKGLEFPIVFVAGLSSAPVNRQPVIAVDRSDGAVAVRIGTKSRNTLCELGDTAHLQGREKEHIDAESARLLYVAATRARDHLVVSLFHPLRVKQCGARRLLDAGAREGAIVLDASRRVDVAPVSPFAGLHIELPAGSTPETFAERRAELVESARRQRYASATSLGALAKNEATDESEPWARGRGGTRLGRAVHATIQTLPLDAGDHLIVPYARAQAVAEAIPDRADEVAELVRRALSSDAAGRARSARRALREVPFAVARDGTIVEGFVDMVIESDDGIEIVDWKTDHLSPADVPERLRSYELQAGLYVLGLEAATGRPVTRVTYVFASAGVEVSPGEPAALRAGALATIASATA
jgi:ATP-dependent helicase/nuclease subunit A